MPAYHIPIPLSPEPNQENPNKRFSMRVWTGPTMVAPIVEKLLPSFDKLYGGTEHVYFEFSAPSTFLAQSRLKDLFGYLGIAGYRLNEFQVLRELS